MNHVNYYAVLEVQRSATPEDLKRAWRALARRYHPDQNANDPAAEERFKQINEAYRVLGDPMRRRQYDLFGAAGPGAFGGGGFGGGGAWAPPPMRTVAPIVQLVRQELDEALRRLRRRRGGDLRVRVTVPFVDALRGSRRVLELPRTAAGVQPERRGRFSFDLPPGLHDGRVLRWRGMGRPGVSGGEPGDLYVFVTVQPHEVFRLEGGALVVPVALTPDERERGVRLEVPTLAGVRPLVVTPGVAVGARLEITGGGVPRPGRPAASAWVLIESLSEAATAARRAALEACVLAQRGVSGGAPS